MSLIEKYTAWAKYPEQYTAKQVLSEIVADLNNNTEVVNENDLLHSVINWVAMPEKPECEWGDFLVRLTNDSVFRANYSRIGTERWLIVGVGDVIDTNPVKYWAELP
jgi:hypothetical protein